jgi:peptidoglycan hydrolase-like protein with peptidoglycan-binding domain
MGAQGLGTGGRLAVDGGRAAPADAPVPVQRIAPTTAPAARAAPAPAVAPMSLTQAQEALNGLGYPVGTADGKLNAKTVAALRTFQKDRGIPINGRLDPKTQEELRK